MYGDKIKKAIARFKGFPRIRQVYMGPLEEYQRKVVYVKIPIVSKENYYLKHMVRDRNY